MHLFTAYALINEIPKDAKPMSVAQFDAFCRAWNRWHFVLPSDAGVMQSLFTIMGEHGQRWVQPPNQYPKPPEVILLRSDLGLQEGSVFCDHSRHFRLKIMGEFSNGHEIAQKMPALWMSKSGEKNAAVVL